MIRQRLIGLAYLVVLALALVGVPALLLALGGNPLPTSVPALEQVWSTLTSPDDGSLFLDAVTWVGWVVWLWIAVSIVVELVGAVRGVSVRRIRGLGVGQRAASVLVGGVLLLVAPATAMAAPAGLSPVHSAPVSAPQNPVSESPTFSYTVRDGDSLWLLADVFLGDGSRWSEISALNPGVAGSPDALTAGETLVMPTTLLGPDRSYVVRPGDSLWVLAEVFLGDGSRWSELRGESGPLTSDVLEVGQRLVVPAMGVMSASDEAPATVSVPEAPTPAPVPAPEAAPVRAPVAEQPAPAPAPIPTPAPEVAPFVLDPTAQMPVFAPELPADVAAEAVSSSDDGGYADVAYIGLGVSAVAALGLASHLGWRRRKQQHRRPRGGRIALPSGGAAETELSLVAAVDAVSTAHIDRALRHVAEVHREDGVALPRVLLVMVDEAVEIGFLEAAELPGPWASTSGFGWAVDPRALPADVVEAVVSPYPALVSIGAGVDDGRELLVNLEEMAHLGLSGAPGDVEGVLRALAIELAVSPIADQVHVHVVGFGAELADVLRTGRVTHHESADAALTRLARWVGSDADLLVRDGVSSVSEARSTYPDSELTAPQVVLINAALTSEQLAVVAQIEALRPRIAFAAVSACEDDSLAWELAIGDDGIADLVNRGVGSSQVVVASLDAGQYAGVVEVLATTDAPADESVFEPFVWEAEVLEAEVARDSKINAVPDLPVDHVDDDRVVDVDDGVPELPHVWIRVLGEPSVTPLYGGSAEGREASLTEIAALLAMHDGVSNAQMVAKIWPHDIDASTGPDKAAKARITRRRNEAMTRLRKWLGETASGELAFVKSGDNTGRTPSRLHPEVTTDWDVWQQLIVDHPARLSTERLVAALALVSGQPFSSADVTAYGWADHLRQDMISTILDVAEEVSTRHIRGDHAPQDFGVALAAAELGLRVDSTHEGSWRAAIIATHFSDADDAADRTQELIDRMLMELKEIDEAPGPETQELLESLSSKYQREHAYRIGAAS